MFRLLSFNKEVFIKKLRIDLKNDLPGKVYHSKMSPSSRKTNNTIHTEPPIDSSILILLYPSNNQIKVVLIKRTTYDGIHSGQISFPGGKFEKKDINLINTALRETKEEIGVSPKLISILGMLTPIYIPISNSNVLPVVGSLNNTPNFNIHKKEVQYIIEVNLVIP